MRGVVSETQPPIDDESPIVEESGQRASGRELQMDMERIFRGLPAPGTTAQLPILAVVAIKTFLSKVP
ncbi:hypothetical protein HMPREF9440_01243 [Sutterella parvirubra YIT 11816]|uniref:Uncharacterized protein n=1 Tax=Sutterella parvirubra YIT 11816 TaxID=762967 RepID=H3KES8_9BURK|nr:hypothetical protein HMPREF9440_01243 [Sutterella parvirubra YIT 11816]